MTALAVHYTFTANTTILPAEVNTNFSEIVAFVNANMVQADGSVAFTDWPTLPTGYASATRAPATKGYVDEIPRVVGGRNIVTSNGAGDVTITHNLGATPVAVNVNTSTMGGAANSGRLVNPVVTAMDGTTFTVRLQDSSGASSVFASLQVELVWTAVQADSASAWSAGHHG